ncbi:MAG: hypothetical protein H8E13_12620 [Actinobacteria bacterium]|nr:hypothetical protein [Actinomycetota bacterium]
MSTGKKVKEIRLRLFLLLLKGIVVGEGNNYEEVIEDDRSAIKFHIETFGKEDLEVEEIVETFVAELIFC